MFPGNEDHCSDLSAFAQAEMRKLPTAHYIMVMPWQRLLLRSSGLSQLPRLRQALTSGRQLIIFPRPRAAMLPQTAVLLPGCTLCLLALYIPTVAPKRNGFISPSVTKNSCTCRSSSPAWADEVMSPPFTTPGYFLLMSPPQRRGEQPAATDCPPIYSTVQRLFSIKHFN